MNPARHRCAFCGRRRGIRDAMGRERAVEHREWIESLGGRGAHAHPSCVVKELRRLLERVVLRARLLSVNGRPVS